MSISSFSDFESITSQAINIIKFSNIEFESLKKLLEYIGEELFLRTKILEIKHYRDYVLIKINSTEAKILNDLTLAFYRETQYKSNANEIYSEIFGSFDEFVNIHNCLTHAISVLSDR